MITRLLILLAALGAVPASQAQTYTWTTLAGRAGGNADGTGAAAQFNHPVGIGVDSGGTLYVADTFNHTIRKITAAGAVTTLAGAAGSPGRSDGAGAAARFNRPVGIAVDRAGNVFVGDTGNHTIRRITPAGVVSTLAGLAEDEGSADGTGGAARFNNPQGVAVDDGGNVFAADSVNNTIRKITAAGVVSTLAGLAGSDGTADGTGATARFGGPTGVAVDPTGNVYVAEAFNHTIRRITPAGVVTTFAGLAGANGSIDGTGTLARFDFPYGVATDAGGNVFVADMFNATVRKISPGGVVTTLAGAAGSTGSTDGTGGAARFSEPGGLTVDTNGNVFVVDPGNHTVRRISANASVTTLAGTAGGSGATNGLGGAARFNRPMGAAVDISGNVLVADTDNHTIRRISADGTVTTLAGSAGLRGSANGTGGAARFASPRGLAADSGGNVYVADSANHTVRRITAAGAVTTLAGSAGNSGSADGTGATARFKSPRGVAVDSSGNVFVADTENHTIRKITPAGVVTTLAGAASSVPGSADGTGNAARFSYPHGVAVDGGGIVYVADTYNQTIRRITPAGAVTILAGTVSFGSGAGGGADGVGAAAQFRYPEAIAVDLAGNLFVADTENSTIRTIDPQGRVTTVGGRADDMGSSADGTGAVARFDLPGGVAVDLAGNVYVADTNNHTVRKGRLADAAGSGRLVNLSVRSVAGTGTDTLIVGFSLAGTGSQPLLLRAVGPTLANFGVSGALVDPTLQVHVPSGLMISSNDNWENPGPGEVSPAFVATTAARLGAFPLPAGARDAALLLTLLTGSYTAQVGGGTGAALVEVYDAGATTGPRLANVSARSRLRTADDLLIAGFVIGGSAPRHVLIRAVGPTLSAFGVTGVLADPKVEVFTLHGPKIAENDDWAGAALSEAFARAGAFALPVASKDAALLITLPPGAYTAQVSGVGGTTGVTLVEVYDLDP